MFLWIFSWARLKVWPCLADLWVPVMGSATLISSISWAVRVSCHSRPANLLHSGSLQLCSQNDWLLFLWLKKRGVCLCEWCWTSVPLQGVFTHLSELRTYGWNVYNQYEKKEKKKAVIRQRPAPSESKTNTGPSAHTSRGLLTCTRLIGDAHSLHDLLIQWVMDSFPLSSTKENTCLSRPNLGLRLSSQDSFGPLLICTMAPGQGQDRLDPKKPSKHRHTPQNLPPITSDWNGPLILGTLPPQF